MNNICSEVHLVDGDIVLESEESAKEYDQQMDFGGTELDFVYVGPPLPASDMEWTTYAWFRSERWSRSESW